MYFYNFDCIIGLNTRLNLLQIYLLQDKILQIKLLSIKLL